MANAETIKSARIDENRLEITFSDHSIMFIKDERQSCCEERFMSTDDDLSSLVGHKLIGITVKPGPIVGQEHDDTHEIQFLEVSTTGGFITIANHNKHNGYYGGFSLQITTDR